MTPVELPRAPGAPDWAAIREEIDCPLCGYNLRGLSEPLCPECGYRFDWPDLLDPTRRRHPWLFEHHPTHNVWSFFKTLVRNFRPGRFWKELHPGQPSRPGRLVIYWMPGAVLAIVPLVLPVLHRWTQWAAWPTTWMWRRPSLLSDLWRDDSFRGLLSLCVLAAVFPWLNVLALLIFQQSMGRAKVKAGHVMRCGMYSGDVILWWGLLAAPAIAYGMWQRWGRGSDDSLALLLTTISLAALLLNFFRLVSAYRNYLKFDHVYATIIAAQVVVLLASFTLYMEVMEFL